MIMSRYNTGNPVLPDGSNSGFDLDDNAKNFDLAVNDLVNDTWTDRLGVVRDTVNGRLKKLGYEVPVVYASGIVFGAADNVKTVQQGGFIYAPFPASLPLTTTGVWADDRSKFFSIQNSGGSSSSGMVTCATVSDMKDGVSILGGVDFASIAAVKGVVDTLANNSISLIGGASYRINTLEQERLDRGDAIWVPDGDVSSPISHGGADYLGGIIVGADHYVGGGTEYVAILQHEGQPQDACFGTIGATVDSNNYNDGLAISLLLDYCRKNRNKANIGGLKPYIYPQSVFYIDNTLDLIDFRVDMNWQGATLRPITPITSVNYESVGAEFKNLYIRHSHLTKEEVYLASNAAITLSEGQPVNVNSESVFNTMSRVLIYNAYRGVQLGSSGSNGGLIWQFAFDEVTAWHSLDYGFYFNSLNQVSTTTTFRSCHTKNVDGAFVQHGGLVYYAIQHMLSSAPVEPGVTAGWEDYWRVKESANGVPTVPSTEPVWESGAFYATNGKGYYINNIQTCALYNCSADGSNNHTSGSVIYALNSAITLDNFHLEGVRAVVPGSPFFDLNSDVTFTGELYLYDLQMNLPDAGDRTPLVGGSLARSRVLSMEKFRNHTQNPVRKGQFDIIRSVSNAGIDFNAVSTGVGISPELVTGTDEIGFYWTDQTVIDYRKPDVNFVMTGSALHYKLYEVEIPNVGETTDTFLEFNDIIEITANSGNDVIALGKSAHIRVSVFVQSGQTTPNKSYFDVEQVSGNGDFIYSTFDTTTRVLALFAKCSANGQVAMMKAHGTNSLFGGGEVPYKSGSTSRLLSVPVAVLDTTVEAMEGYDSVPLGRQATKAVVSPYTITNGDSGYWLIFNDASDAVLNIPDGLRSGRSLLATNIGSGGVSATMIGSEVLRGADTLGNADGFLSLTKLTSTIWQSSERA